MERSYDESYDDESVRVLAGWPNEPGHYYPLRLLWKLNERGVSLMALTSAQIFPFLADAKASFPKWERENPNKVLSIQAMQLCAESFISAVAYGSFDSCTFVRTSSAFQTAVFLEFKQVLKAQVSQHQSSMLQLTREAIGQCSALGGVFGPLASSVSRLLDSAVPQLSKATSTGARVEQQAGTAAGDTDESPIGLPPMNSWPLKGPPPSWAYEFDFVTHIRQCTNVDALRSLYISTLKPLESRYGASAEGVVRGKSWRGAAVRGTSATNAWWMYQPLFCIFDYADANMVAYQSQIDM